MSTTHRLAGLLLVALVLFPSCGGRRAEQFRQQGDTMLQLGKYDEAAEFYDRALEADADNAAAVVGQGRVLAARDQYDEALEKFEAALRMDAANADAYEAAVGTLIEAGRKDEALAMAAQFEAVDQDKAAALIATINKADKLSAEVQPMVQAPAQGVESATAAPANETTAAGASDRDWEVLWREGAISELVQRRGEWQSVSDPRLDQALVMAAVFNHNLDLAQQLAEALPADSPLRGYLEVVPQNDLEKLVAFMKTWEPDPENGFEAALYNNALAYALGRGGARARAIQILSQTLERFPDYRVTMANVSWIYRVAGMPEQETRVLQRWVLDAPENMDARTMLFERYRRSSAFADARQAAEVAYSLYPENARASLNLAQAYLDSGDYGVALATLDKASQTHPNDARLGVARAEVFLHSDQPQNALDEIDGLKFESADSDLTRRSQLLEAFALAALGKWTEVAAMRGIVEDSGEVPGLTARLLLTAALLRQDQSADAARIMVTRESSSRAPHPLEAVVMAALDQDQELLTGQELVDPMRQQPEMLADFAYGCALKFAGLHEDSLEVFESLDSRAPQSSLLVDLMMRALLQGVTIEDRYDKAKTLAEEHATLPVAWIDLAQIAHAVGDDAGEVEALERAAQAGPDDAAVWMQRGQYFSRKNMIPEATEAFRKQLQINPDDVAALNNLAYYLTLSGENLEEALERAQKAKDIMGSSPSVANVLHTLGVAQLRAGKLEESKENLTMALELRPGDPTLMLDYGQLLIKTGQENEGRRHIQMGLRFAELLGLDFPRRDEAVQLIGQPEPATTS